MCARKRSDSAGWSCSSSSICDFFTTSTAAALMAEAVAMRRGCPARQPSPRKSPGPSTATTASRPARDSTDSLMVPCWMYRTSSAASPCALTGDGARTPAQFHESLTAGTYDLVLAEHPNSMCPPAEILRRLRRVPAEKQVPLIFIADALRRDTAADLVAMGAADCDEDEGH